MFDRTWRAPEGRFGGRDGTAGEVKLKSGGDLKSKGRQSIPYNDRLVLELPGGGGYGDPAEREPERVAEDVRDGLITAEDARRDYGVVIRPDGSLDQAATETLREGMARGAPTVAAQ